jgi:hypothetical protein
MISVPLPVKIALLLASCLVTQPAAAADRELLSIKGVTLPNHGYVSGFNIDTWGVRVISVCHLPPASGRGHFIAIDSCSP